MRFDNSAYEAGWRSGDGEENPYPVGTVEAYYWESGRIDRRADEAAVELTGGLDTMGLL